MSSLVTDLLYSAGELRKDDIPSKVDELRKKIEDIKLEVQQMLKNRYIDFIPQYDKLDKFSSKLENASNESDVLVDQIEKEIKPQMSGLTAEFQEMLQDLKKIRALKSAICKLIDVHLHLENAKNYQVDKDFTNGARSLLDFQAAFNGISEEQRKGVEIYVILNSDMFATKEKIIFEVDEQWKKLVYIQQHKNVDCFKMKSTLTISSNNSKEYFDIVQSMDLLGHIKTTLRKFGLNLMKLFFEPIILHITEVEVIKNNGLEALSVSTISEDSPTPSDVFSSLIQVISVLSDTFPKIPSLSANTSQSNEIIPVLRILGNSIEKDFCSLLIDKCIKPAVPNQSNQLENFQSTINQAVNMHNVLLDLGFFASDENLLLQFIQNVDTLPANRMAQDYLCRARSLMKEGLHHLVTVGVESLPSSSKASGDLNEMARTKSGLSKATFSFPRCQISVFAKDLVSLLHKVLQEAQSTTSTYSVRLYYTVRNICELYCAVVPVYHKEEIATIPQQSAIHHNNCFYLAHCLLTIGAQYELALPSTLSMTFVDLVPEIRKIGTEAFLAQMRCQRQLLLQSLKDSEAFRDLACVEGVFPKAEKAVHQCLCQLGLLKKVWSDILPIEVYLKAIGTLLNTCLEEIIQHVTNMEDIAASSAAQLDSVFTIILKQAPSLLTVKSVDECNSVHLYARKWFKFQELQLVLGINLREIVDRWSSGKGPLASHFTADEVKHLIRALFQNTERRAAALARIQ